jgi:hypothetical protein
MLIDRRGNTSPARDLPGGRVEFALNPFFLWGCVLLGVRWVWLSIDVLSTSHGKPIEILMGIATGLFALVLFTMIPATIVVGDQGLVQQYWLARSPSLGWKEIVEIDTGKLGQTVTIKSSGGTKITHSFQLADRPRFLDELKRRCGEELPEDFPREPVSRPQ